MPTGKQLAVPTEQPMNIPASDERSIGQNACIKAKHTSGDELVVLFNVLLDCMQEEPSSPFSCPSEVKVPKQMYVHCISA